MKKLLFAAVAVLGLATANAQEEVKAAGFAEGDVYVSGTVGYNSTSVADVDSSEFTFSPSAGYFITENLAIEAGLIFGSTEDFSEDKTSSFGGSLGANYFFTPANNFSFTLGAGVAYVSSKIEPNGGTELESDTIIAAVTPGINYFVSPCIALRASVGALSYSSSKADVDGAEAVNNFGINLDFSNINFGITYKF